MVKLAGFVGYSTKVLKVLIILRCFGELMY
ncbi:hypothetical protein BAPA111461_25670 [Bacillus paramycoides]